MDKTADELRIQSLIVIFTYAPAGLGHLRVTDALYHGMPTGIPHILLGAADRSIGYIHRIASIHPLGNKIMEWLQRGKAENVFTSVYRRFLQRRSHLLYQQIVTILAERLDEPKTILVVATHFALAHELGAIKNRLAIEQNKSVILVVQVTDDSPQHLWYVPGADLIVVPSNTTRNRLLSYGRQFHLGEVPFVVLPYPLSPMLSEQLTHAEFEERISQIQTDSNKSCHLIVPISGAAVGLPFLTNLIQALIKRSPRFSWHILAKQTIYTKSFLGAWKHDADIHVTISRNDREVVEQYEDLYQHNIFALELTKPSEQAFKALLRPKQRGGIILLLAQPVGQQEKDNLDFLKRHLLIPTDDKQDLLWRIAQRGTSFEQEELTDLRTQAVNWRGLRLPADGVLAAEFILWCLRERLFEYMMRCEVHPHPDDTHRHELGDNGVEEFWQTVAKLVLSKIKTKV